MRLYILLLSFLVAVWANYELPLAEPCNEEACRLPNCRCSSTNIPGGLAARDTPQFVMVTFDDGININNIETYREILYNRSNKNSCSAGATFYVSHEYTNYQLVNELYNQGFEIALHSISHQTNLTYWGQATYNDMMREFGEQRILMSHFANVSYDEIQGSRIPFLQMTGNANFKVMADVGLTYDSSWPTISHVKPGLWPYTLDYATSQDCTIPPCPTASIPGTWVLPMVSWLDMNGLSCSMVDGCFWTPNLDDEDAWFEFIVTNFKRHYLNNRAPFGFFVHEWYIRYNPAIKRALDRFMDMINQLDDVFMVNSAEVIDWVRNPIRVSEYVQKPCRTVQPTSCSATTCTLYSEHNELNYWVQMCNVCPRTYPWLGNPLGL